MVALFVLHYFDLCDHVPLFVIHKHKGVLNANNTTSTNQSFWLDSAWIVLM